MEELFEENGGENGLLENAVDEKGKINKGSLAKAIKDLGKRRKDNADEYDMLEQYKWLVEEEAETKKAIKDAQTQLEQKLIAKYPKLSINEIKTLALRLNYKIFN
jgi:type I restriction enzyme M protein